MIGRVFVLWDGCLVRRFVISFFLLLGVLVMGVEQIDAVDLPEGVRLEKDVVYGTVGDRELVLDLYWYPNSEQDMPLIIWVHGGAWRRGSKDNPRAALHMLKEGYALASVGYRLSGEAIFPAQIQDCKAAVRWLRAHASAYKLDGEKFGAWGSSAGGHLVALMGTSNEVSDWEVGEHLDVSSRVQAVCDWFGPTDLLRMNDVEGKLDHNAPNSPESQLIGAPIQEHPDLAGNANPINYISEDDPPFLIMHGGADRTVIPNQSEFLNVALHEQGVPSTFVWIDGQGHGFKGMGAENRFLVKAFFDLHLLGKKNEWLENNPYPWIGKCDPGREGMRHVLFKPETLDEYYTYSVYLPPSYETDPERRFPVMYWLHALKGNSNGVRKYLDWFDEAMRAGDCPEMIIVGPNGLPISMHTNSKDGQYPVETVVVEDVIAHVDATFRTVAERSGRVVDGFSMGGYGAAYLGFKYPDIFCGVSIMGAAIHRPEYFPEGRPEIFDFTFKHDMDYAVANSPWTLAAQNVDVIKTQVIRQYIGGDDRLLEKNKDFHAHLESLGISHTFGIVPGVGHSAVRVYKHMTDDPFAFYLEAFGPSF